MTMKLKTLTEGADVAQQIGYGYMDELCRNGTDAKSLRELERVKERVFKKIKMAHWLNDKEKLETAEEMSSIFTIITATVTGVGRRLDEEKERVKKEYGNKKS